MSNLQKLVNSIIQVIIDYYHTQVTKASENQYDYEEMVSMPPEELAEKLDNLIRDATKKYSNRGPLLNYFKFVLITLKPLVDKGAPLSEKEINIVDDMLSALIDNCNNLLHSDHNQSLAILYNNDPVFLNGFSRGLRSLSCAGQLIKDKLLIFFEFSKKKDKHKDYDIIKKTIAEFIVEHQSPLVFNQMKEANSKLEQREQELLAKLFEMEQVNSALKEQVNRLTERVDDLVLQNSEQQKTIDDLKNIRDAQEHEIEGLKIQISNSNQKQNSGLNRKDFLSSNLMFRLSKEGDKASSFDVFGKSLQNY